MRVIKFIIFMQNYDTLTLINFFVEKCLILVDEKIDQLEINKQMPKYLSKITNSMIYQLMLPIAFPAEQQNRLRQQLSSQIPKINKDSLMPKDMNKEKAQQTLSISSRQTNFPLKQLSSIRKRSSISNTQAMRSVSLVDKRSQRQKKQNDANFSSLAFEPDEDDPQIFKLRERTEMRLKHQYQYQKLTLFREKSFKEKFQMLSQLLQKDPDGLITHDYEGQHIKSVIQDDKIKHHSIKAEFGAAKKVKDRYIKQQQSVIEVTKYKLKELDPKTITPMQMPLFPAPSRDFTHLYDSKNYKLHDYKKHFGRKYSRLDQYSQTLDLTMETKEHQEEFFTQRKHLRDSSLISQTKQKQQGKIPRRLALPKLHGKYKVLDRYEQA